MEKTDKNKTSIILAELFKMAKSKSVEVQFNTYKMTDNSLKKGEKSPLSSYVNEDYVVLSKNLLNDLSSGEINIVSMIMMQLKRNNLFWHFDYRKVGGRKERAVLQLKKKNILL